jgi:hypothetical protein
MLWIARLEGLRSQGSARPDRRCGRVWSPSAPDARAGRGMDGDRDEEQDLHERAYSVFAKEADQ